MECVCRVVVRCVGEGGGIGELGLEPWWKTGQPLGNGHQSGFPKSPAPKNSQAWHVCVEREGGGRNWGIGLGALVEGWESHWALATKLDSPNHPGVAKHGEREHVGWEGG